jgi:nicotinamidase-related amidase
LKPAVLVIDVINDFVSGVMESERSSRVIRPIMRLLGHARRNGIPVIYASDSHTPDDREFDLWPNHAMEGSWGAQVVDELKPQVGDHRINKHCYSAFHGTELDVLLKGLDVDTVVITGLVTNICVQHAAADAYFRGYDVVVPSDCVEARSDEEQEAGLRYIQRNYGARITTSEALMKKPL